MATPIVLQIPADVDGERLDKVIADLLGVSRAVARTVVEAGVTVDEKPGTPKTRVFGGSLIVALPPPEPVALEPEPIEFEVLLEDEEFIVVNKAPGVVVHPGAGQMHGTLAAGLLFRYPELRGVGAEGRWGLVHRLDKGTSGALLVARTDSSYKFLSHAIRGREVKREYVALVDGLLKPPTGTIDAPIGRDPVHPTRRAVTLEGKRARTHYQLVRNFESARVALVDVRLETGRTHQIRVHFAAIGHAVIGDTVYGMGSHPVKSPRVFLHAGKLTFRHPSREEEVVVSAPLPADLNAVVASLDTSSVE